MNNELLTKELVSFIANTFQSSGFTDAVIALSGGIDSALSCTLAVQALGADHVFPLLLPYGTLNKKGEEDALVMTEFLHIPEEHITTINIEPMVNQIVAYDTDLATEPLRKGNIMARTRMILVFDQAKKRTCLVIGTENKSEHYLGYYTRFGDEASDLEPLRELYKTQVFELARYLHLPEAMLTKAPTAGLWEGQTDEQEFGFSYQDADEILELYIDEKKSEKDIVALGKKEDVVRRVIQQVTSNAFKHNLPYLQKSS